MGSQNGDYINANYVNMEIPGSGIINRYIATQGPLSSTVSDFWQMILEAGSTLVVMLTTLVERGRSKCFQYWPDLGETLSLRNLTISSTSKRVEDTFVFREFILRNISVRCKIYQICKLIFVTSYQSFYFISFLYFNFSDWRRTWYHAHTILRMARSRCSKRLATIRCVHGIREICTTWDCGTCHRPLFGRNRQNRSSCSYGNCFVSYWSEPASLSFRYRPFHERSKSNDDTNCCKLQTSGCLFTK